MNRPVATCEAAQPALHHVAAGQGETVLLLHGSASTGALWRQTMQALQPLYRVVAPDLLGYGRSPAWLLDARYSITTEMHAVESLLPCCAEKYHLVGHSYGGVVALMLALAHPTRLRTVTLIEPVFFAALRYCRQQAAYRRFCEVRDTFLATLARGAAESAMREFVGFWAGDEAWKRMSDMVRAGMVQMAGRIVLDWQASFRAEAEPHRLAALGPRMLLLSGERSPEPMLRLVDALHAIVPGSTAIRIAGAGHLLPLTHVAEVTRAMLGHLHIEAERRSR